VAAKRHTGIQQESFPAPSAECSRFNYYTSRKYKPEMLHFSSLAYITPISGQYPVSTQQKGVHNWRYWMRCPLFSAQSTFRRNEVCSE